MTLQCRERASLPSREVQFVFPNRPDPVPHLRMVFSDWLEKIGADDDEAFEISVAVGEAVANACLHGARSSDRGHIEVRCLWKPPKVTIIVADRGPGFEWESVRAEGLSDSLAAGGRGFFLMQEWMDEFEVQTSELGTKVTLMRALGGRDGRSECTPPAKGTSLTGGRS